MWWVLLFGLIGAVIVAMIADHKGRNVMGWFVFGLVLWPFALVAIFLEDNRSPDKSRLPCPHCAELVLAKANVCPHCQTELVDVPMVSDVPRLELLADLDRKQSKDNKLLVIFVGVAACMLALAAGIAINN
jgi:hypothetical protein